MIVDPTVRLQNPPGDIMNDFTPPIVAVEEAALTKPTIDDVGGELRDRYARMESQVDNQLHHRLVPQLDAFGRNFPSRQVQIGELSLRYVPAATRVSDVALEEINGAGQGMAGAQVWHGYVVPAFSKFIVHRKNR